MVFHIFDLSEPDPSLLFHNPDQIKRRCLSIALIAILRQRLFRLPDGNRLFLLGLAGFFGLSLGSGLNGPLLDLDADVPHRNSVRRMPTLTA